MDPLPYARGWPIMFWTMNAGWVLGIPHRMYLIQNVKKLQRGRSAAESCWQRKVSCRELLAVGNSSPQSCGVQDVPSSGSHEATWARTGQSTFSANYKARNVWGFIYKSLDVKTRKFIFNNQHKGKGGLFVYCLRKVPETGLGNHCLRRWKPSQSQWKCWSEQTLPRMDKLQPSFMRREKPNPALLVE